MKKLLFSLVCFIAISCYSQTTSTTYKKVVKVGWRTTTTDVTTWVNGLNNQINILTLQVSNLNDDITTKNTQIANLNTLLNACLSTIPVTPPEDTVVTPPVDTVIIPPEDPLAAKYYISTGGSDNNAGTFDKPFATLQKAASVAQAGDLVYIRGGVYYANKSNGSYHTKIEYIGGSEGKYIKFWAYPGETPVFDCSTLTSKVQNYGFEITSCIYLWFKGLEIRNVPQLEDYYLCVGIYGSSVSSYPLHHIIMENMVVHNNSGPGIVFGGDNYSNTFKNCDVYNNYDSYSGGNNADGIDIRSTSRTGTNRLVGCRAWYNSDDGFDFWDNEGTVIVDSCWSFLNGYIPGTKTQIGDGNGIKLGRTQQTKLSSSQRIIRNCITVLNYKSSVNQNGASVDAQMFNNVFGHGVWGALYLPITGLKHTLQNNILLDDEYDSSADWSGITGESNTIGSGSHVIDHNSWNGSVNLTSADFVSVDETQLDNARQSDGSLPIITFLNLVTGSDLINAGINVGLPYKGSAPEIGAFETQ